MFLKDSTWILYALKERCITLDLEKRSTLTLQETNLEPTVEPNIQPLSNMRTQTALICLEVTNANTQTEAAAHNFLLVAILINF